MKKTALSILLLLLLTAVAAAALADADVRVAKKDVKVYEERSSHSSVIKKIRKGSNVLIDVDYGSWVGVLVEADDGQDLGWVQSKYLECKHNWTDWEVTRKATCSRAGVKTRYCTRCGAEQTKEIAKLEHKFGKWTVVRKGRCDRPGLQRRECKVCGYEEEKELVVPHTFDDWVITKQPSCTEKGSRQHMCEVCGYVEARSIDMLPHDFEYEVIVEATDHSSGTRARVCRVCGYTEDAQSYDPEGTLRRRDRGEEVRRLQQLLVDQGYLNAGGADGVYGGGTEKAIMQFQKDQHLDPDGVAWPQTQKRLQHDFGPWETVKPMTRSESGIRQRVCKDCGYIQRETIEAGGTIQRGSRGENVRAIQQMLKTVGYSAGSCDGIYGGKMDTAFQSFESVQGMSFEAGKVKPADLDALVNAWLGADGDLSQSNLGTPVDMALTVTPAADEAADQNATTYTWTLTNMGSRACMYNVLLLAYGKDPDFTRDVLVMDLQGFELKPNCANSTSGSFTVASDWGSGSLNFAALAVDEKSDAKWLSNAVVFEAAAQGEPKVVAPLDAPLNVNALADGTYPVAFDAGDIAKVTSGIYMNAVHFFTLDTYDRAAVASLAAGDTLVVDGREIAVESVEADEVGVSVNGGLSSDDGVLLVPTESGDAYRVMGFDDMPTYTERGLTTLMVNPSAVFIDDADIDAGEVTANYDKLAEAIRGSDFAGFNPYNTTLTIENGRVAEIYRAYTP